MQILIFQEVLQVNFCHFFYITSHTHHSEIPELCAQMQEVTVHQHSTDPHIDLAISNGHLCPF